MAPLGRLLGLAAMDADDPPPAPPKPRRPRGRPPIHLSASLNLLLPSQLFPEFPSEGRVPGERRLMLAVLKDAIGILVKHRDASEHCARVLYCETAAWVLSDDTEWPFSFVNVCEAIGFSPSCVRRGLSRFLPR
jgi:hypothetical protein